MVPPLERDRGRQKQSKHRAETTLLLRHYGQKEVRPMQIYIYLSNTATITKRGREGRGTQ